MIYATIHNFETNDGYVKALYLAVSKLRLMLAWAENNWYTKGKERKIPIWINKHGLFIYRFSCKVKLMKKEAQQSETT